MKQCEESIVLDDQYKTGRYRTLICEVEEGKHSIDSKDGEKLHKALIKDVNGRLIEMAWRNK